MQDPQQQGFSNHPKANRRLCNPFEVKDSAAMAERKPPPQYKTIRAPSEIGCFSISRSMTPLLRWSAPSKQPASYSCCSRTSITTMSSPSFSIDENSSISHSSNRCSRLFNCGEESWTVLLSHAPNDGLSHFKICVSLQTRLQICSAPVLEHGVQHRPKRTTRKTLHGHRSDCLWNRLALLTYLSVIPATLGWLAVAGSIFGGAFAIFEARKGWCIVRAVGIKTPL